MKLNSLPPPISDRNLSRAWAKLLLAALDAKDHEAQRLVITLEAPGSTPKEDPTLRSALDRCLKANKLKSVETVAAPIFPQGLWDLAGGDRKELYRQFLRNLPSYTVMEPANGRGMYFARLMAFDLDPRTGKSSFPKDSPNPKNGESNQLEYIIANCKPAKRRSMFQAAIFDPRRDHSKNPRPGFPCMQHVQFLPDFDEKTMTLNAFYATQYAVEKAYGNLLGLARLGAFVASQTGLEFAALNLFIGLEILAGKTIVGMSKLEAAATRLVEAEHRTRPARVTAS